MLSVKMFILPPKLLVLLGIMPEPHIISCLNGSKLEIMIGNWRALASTNFCNRFSNKVLWTVMFCWNKICCWFRGKCNFLTYPWKTCLCCVHMTCKLKLICNNFNKIAYCKQCINKCRYLKNIGTFSEDGMPVRKNSRKLNIEKETMRTWLLLIFISEEISPSNFNMLNLLLSWIINFLWV